MNFKSLKPMRLIIAPFLRLGKALGDFLSSACHKHDWIPAYKDVLAYYSKRNSEDDRIEMTGTVFYCDCGKQMFYPYSGDLPPVEVSLENQ